MRAFTGGIATETSEERPPLTPRETGAGTQWVACHFR
jgi:hypothetical protein